MNGTEPTDPEYTNAIHRIEAHPEYQREIHPPRTVRTDSLAYRWAVSYWQRRQMGESHEEAIRRVENLICIAAIPPFPPMWEIPVPPIPPVVTLPRLRKAGQQFELETGEPFTAVECSDFNLLNRWQHGEDITPVLAQRLDAGYNMLRVWTLYNLAAAHIGVFLDIDYARIAAFLSLCAQHRLYVEFTAYTSTERPEHWGQLVAACQGTSALLELVNEGTLPVNQIDMDRYPRPSGVLASHGSGGSEGVPPWEPWDYITFHTNGANEEQRKIGHNAWEIWPGPTLTNETSRYPDVGMWVGSNIERCRALAYDAAAGAALLCAGSCFHSALGKTSQLWDANTEAVARAWAAGAKSVPMEFQHGRYIHRTDLEGPEDLRVYERRLNDGRGHIVTIRK